MQALIFTSLCVLSVASLLESRDNLCLGTPIKLASVFYFTDENIGEHIILSYSSAFLLFTLVMILVRFT